MLARTSSAVLTHANGWDPRRVWQGTYGASLRDYFTTVAAPGRSLRRIQAEHSPAIRAPDAVPAVRAVHASRQLHDAQVRWNGPGPGDLASVGRADEGSDRCRQDPGEGSTFWCTLVVGDAHAAVYRAAPHPNLQTDCAGAFAIPHGPILVVEDWPISQRVALGLLKKLGHGADGLPTAERRWARSLACRTWR